MRRREEDDEKSLVNHRRINLGSVAAITAVVIQLGTFLVVFGNLPKDLSNLTATVRQDSGRLDKLEQNVASHCAAQEEHTQGDERRFGAIERTVERCCGYSRSH